MQLPYAPWSSALLAAALSAVALALLEAGRARLPQDHPSERSLHVRPVARVGGIAIWAGFLPVALLLGASRVGASISDAWILLLAWMAVTGVSIADDWRGVRPTLRLAVHAIAALAVALALLRPGESAQPAMQALAVAAAAL